MKAAPAVARTDDLGQHGPWRFTREHVVEPELALAFYELYEAAFAPLRVRAMARQVLTEDEFRAQMANGAVSKIVAWDATGAAVGLCSLTQQLSAVPWISPEFFAARYPEHWERRAVWYLAFVLAHPAQRHSRFLDRIVEVGVGPLVEAGAVCAYDMCAYNDDVLGLGARLSRCFERTSGAIPRLVDTQNYYEVRFS